MVDILEYYCYEINGIYKWTGILRAYSLYGLNNIEMDFCTFDGLCETKETEDFRCVWMSREQAGLGEYCLTTALPKAFSGKDIQLKLRTYNNAAVQVGLKKFDAKGEYENTSYIRVAYHEDFEKIGILLQNFRSINIDNELQCLENMPELIQIIIPILQDVLDRKELIRIDQDEIHSQISFKVPATYDKKYFCAAKLADNAESVLSLAEGTEYLITFNGNQLDDIELMCYLFYDVENDEEVKNRDFLRNHSIRYYTIDSLQDFLNNYFKNYGWSSILANSVLVRIIKNEQKEMQNKVDRIYSEIVKENRVPTRWGNEYRLFSLISFFCPDAVYQYHCDWLGQQSFDIYLEEQKIAIEYQGQQHYEAVEYFGGEESLKSNQERDAKKKLLCLENGVKLLEWSYLVEVNNENVRQFLEGNGITIDEGNKTVYEINSIMAPVIQPKEKAKPPKKSKEIVVKYYIVQYDLQGNYIDRFTNIGDAAEKVGVSNTSISKVLRGERNSAANFIWKRYNVDDKIPEKLDVLFDTTKTNARAPKRIGRMAETGIVVDEYDSISDAARLTGVSAHHIQNELKKGQSMEWKYL